ncbi:MAG TPA: M36 family metallopeptidase [Albitalea sp.]|nr:M36 family metallopeptidase [Albitalea sp.]
MSINFIPNDPAAGAKAPPARVIKPRRTRPAGRSGFTYSHTSPQGVAQPGTPKFLFWQAREAGIAAVEAFEAAVGPHVAWQGKRKKLPLLQDAGIDLNAFYDRASFSFFHEAVGSRVFFSGESTDVVSHEVGHGLLDSVRPELWDVNFLEVGAFHEAFGDCIALLTALEDKPTRQKLLQAAPTLRKRNFVESTAEELSKAIGLAFPGHNASQPRHAFNSYQYQIPSTLPADGGPGVLINEVHSFGMLFTGPFWDLIANLFAAAPAKNEANLLAAARTAGRILVAGAKDAVVTPRFLQSVGRAMTLADQSLNGGAHRDKIRAAFARHGIALGSNALLAPSMVLAGTAPTGATLRDATRKDLLRRLGNVRGARLDVKPKDMAGTPMVAAVQTHAVSLSGIDPRLKGVVAMAQVPVLVGATGERAAVMGALPHPTEAEDEVRAFVQSLLAHNRIRIAAPAKAARAAPTHADHTTHAIATVGGKKVLRRVRFSCACHPGLRLFTDR